MIKTTYTETIDGAIPHLKHGELLCPVKLVRQGPGKLIVDERSSMPEPLKMFGQYVYALPGGGEVVA